MSIEISSEAAAWELLEQLLSNEIEIESVDDLVFGDWVKAKVYIPEQRYDSALNAYMMQGWQEAQRALYRSYAVAAKGASDARSLSDLERDKLEIIVKVKSGSSDQEAEFIDVLKEAVVAAVGNMEPHQIAIVLVVAILSWTGVTVTRHWLSKRAEIKLAEIEAGSKKGTDELLAKAFEAVAQKGEDREKIRLIEKAKEELPAISAFTDEAENATQSLVKHSSQTDSNVNGVGIPAELGRRLTRETRAESQEQRLDGNYRVLKVDTTVPDGFRVFIEDIDTHESFGADVQEVMSSLSDREIIRDAEWSKAPVTLQINAKVKRGVVQEATILRATKLEFEDDPSTSGNDQALN